MKTIFILVAIVINAYSSAQSPVTPQVIKASNHIIKLIEEDSIEVIADLMSYPVSRGFPPAIYNKNEFITAYKSFFDSLSRQAIKKKFTLNETTLDLIAGNYSLLGLFELCGNGIITSFSYYPGDWRMDMLSWQKKDQHEMPQILKSGFIENKLICKAGTWLLRLDETEKGFRLAMWADGMLMTEKPVKVLYYVQPANISFGSEGMFTYYFKDGTWNYTLYKKSDCPVQIIFETKKDKHNAAAVKCLLLK